MRCLFFLSLGIVFFINVCTKFLCVHVCGKILFSKYQLCIAEKGFHNMTLSELRFGSAQKSSICC